MAGPTSSRVIGDLTSQEVGTALSATSILCLAMGSMEQHGPHLPLNTDTVLAEAFTGLSQPRWKDVIAHYQRYLEIGPKESVNYAYALNNISLAYRRVGDCARARESAEKALALMKFGMAEWNKRYAEACLEMQESGLVALH